ncbi:unnamed protein product [Brassica oleracea]|uniref:Uncharacterized protein n=1 Tax=Brassica oleracea TaxID=3712 RepID=A0A3P6DFC5_BRAOL|nr:unnamed protein product [Brassica oleracea]
MTIILNGRVECMKSHQQRTTLQSAGYQYLETKLENLVVLAERELQAAVLSERELQAAVLTEREFQKAVLATHKETYGGGIGRRTELRRRWRRTEPRKRRRNHQRNHEKG